MKKRVNIIRFINLIVLLCGAFILIYEYHDFEQIFSGITCKRLIILITAVCFVHAVKSMRLFFSLYGEEISIPEYVRIYCKVTPISMIFPFKLGEFFRMLCYGNLIGNGIKGVVIVLLDRFFDTIAVITVIFVMKFFAGGEIATVVYILLIFILLTLSVYFAYPSVASYWKRYLMEAKSTEMRLAILKVMDRIHGIYTEIANVVKGRGFVLYFLSLLAWGIEIGSVALADIGGKSQISGVLSEYLSSAMTNGRMNELRRFIFVSIVVLLLVYLLQTVRRMIKSRAKV